MKYIAETQRLKARELTIHDTDFILELLNSPGWIKFIGDRQVKTKAQALQYLEKGPFSSYKQHGFGLWLVERKEDFNAIGLCGLIKRDYLEHPDIGFAFLPAYYGKGYAYEIASEIIKYATEQFSIPQLWAIALPENTRSIRLLEKLGFRFIKTVYPPSSQEQLQLFGNTPMIKT
ncbi:GNAT family N-acetyltransferase [Rhodocytophaga rosea]|uniref:GNAT family N-acetyltransferase n=1 Tax=Rhodocytophaga rosea TaxID=2704465 RepID=A0A6C0GCZ5_9BACT|nr:GNAT family N-acetyltransferase [Rhodocytophaga rosea]QHT65560.1 GNAT family N-acetyltransferase [Rhodocytophaga rosea]